MTMVIIKSERAPIESSSDIVKVRQVVRTWAADLGLSLVDQTKIVTAASELARNTFEYGGGGQLVLETVENGIRRGLRLTFTDSGPGIPDIAKAMTDGYTSGNGMGMGLSGSKRLVNDFAIDSTPGKGTTVTVVRWK
ncbi:MAG TPA: anti-sigma regulatory factor [Capsulimonadaceae bacterium]|jgi:serine/threonine-protein kinase RsbT